MILDLHNIFHGVFLFIVGVINYWLGYRHAKKDCIGVIKSLVKGDGDDS